MLSGRGCRARFLSRFSRPLSQGGFHGRHTTDPRAELSQLFLDDFVAAIDVIDPVHERVRRYPYSVASMSSPVAAGR